jgi:hypothetical protein
MTDVQKEECIELKNIKYKSMLLSRNAVPERKSSTNLLNLEKYLEDEKMNIQNEPWSKLDKTIKTRKLIFFANNYSKEKGLNEEEEELLIAFFKDCLDRKKLQKVKDVEYNKETGIITNVPALFYTKSNKHFTLKNMDKRVSTLKSLPPKRCTAKNLLQEEIQVNE